MANNLKEMDMDKCTGCKMCGDLCTQDAISFCDSNEGFWYPIIDEGRCINCGRCMDNCPPLRKKSNEGNAERRVYAAASRKGEVRDQSTSGGIFFELATSIINAGGVVIGCSFSEDYRSAYHRIAEDNADLVWLVGSKYVQSDTGGIYRKTQELLEEGKIVLFAGTPCQNAALRSYLSKEYSSLYQMDFICNSINSPLVYRKWVEELEQNYHAKMVRVRFKDKSLGWKKLTIKVFFENGAEHTETCEDSPWIAGFNVHNLYQRKSCYNCQFRGEDNIHADITVGDFWGLEDENPYDAYKGISLLMVNSPKGAFLFQKIKKELFVKEKSIEEVKKGNPRWIESPQLGNERKVFFEQLKTMPFSISVAHTIGFNQKEKKKERLTWNELKNIWRQGKVSVIHYIYFNYFAKNIVRMGKAKIIPYKHAIFELNKTSKIILYGDHDFEVGFGKLKKSKVETHIRLAEDSTMIIKHGGILYSGVMIDLKEHSKFETGFFSMNSGSAIIVQHHVVFGEEVIAGRNCFVMDSDFHQIQVRPAEPCNPPSTVIVGNRVWMTGNVRVLGGSVVGENSIIGAYVTIKGKIPMGSSVSAGSSVKVTKFKGMWSIKSNHVIYDEINSKAGYRQILVGFGKEGKDYYKKQKEFIDIIIDNHSMQKGIVSFAQFKEKYAEIEDSYIFVIGSSKFYKELYQMVKNAYPNAKICDKDRIFYPS